MILNIKYNKQKISIHCTGLTTKKRTYHISGVGEEAKNAIDAIGLKYGKHASTGTLCIFKQKTLLITEANPRTAYQITAKELAIGEHFYGIDQGRKFIYEGNLKAFYTPKWGKETVTLTPEEIVKPCTDVPTKEIKVRFYRRDYDGNCKEIWQSESVNGLKTYFGRDIADGNWCVLSDAPNGLCEPSHSTGPNFIFIVCDQQWNEVLRDANNQYLYPDKFPSLDRTTRQEWEKIKENYPDTTTDGFSVWLNSKKPEKISNREDMNWCYSMQKCIDPDNLLGDFPCYSRDKIDGFKCEILHRYTYFGETYAIVRLAHKHDICDACWYAYLSYSLEDNKLDEAVTWHAYELDIEINNPKTE